MSWMLPSLAGSEEIRVAIRSDSESRGLFLDRAASAEAGVLGRRGYVVENAAARVCREVGARATTAVWKLWRMGCHSSMVLTWLSTLLWSRCSRRTEHLTHDVPPSAVQLCKQLGIGNRQLIPSAAVSSAGRTSSKLQGGGLSSVAVSSASCQRPQCAASLHS